MSWILVLVPKSSHRPEMHCKCCICPQSNWYGMIPPVSIIIGPGDLDETGHYATQLLRLLTHLPSRPVPSCWCARLPAVWASPPLCTTRVSSTRCHGKQPTNCTYRWLYFTSPTHFQLTFASHVTFDMNWPDLVVNGKVRNWIATSWYSRINWNRNLIGTESVWETPK